MKRLFMTFAASVFLLVGAASSAALAGEVKGPPNQVDNTNETGALDHANSACAASGLNDFDTRTTPTDVVAGGAAAEIRGSSTSPRPSWGKLGLCTGGTGQVSHP